MHTFKAKLLNTELITEPSDGLRELVKQYNVCLAELLDTFAPLTERKIRSSNRHKWYNDGIYMKKQRKRAIARKYRKSMDQHDLHLLLQQRNKLKSAMSSAKCEYVSDAVKHDQKALYQQFNVLLYRTKENPVPDYL